MEAFIGISLELSPIDSNFSMDWTETHMNIKINLPDNVVTLQMYLIVMIFFSGRFRVGLAQRGMIAEFET